MSEIVRSDTKVLVVEDDKSLRELLQMELFRSGYKVTATSSGEEGLEAYREEIFNVVLQDIRMPGMDGVETLKLMRGESTIPEIIMFTGHGTIETLSNLTIVSWVFWLICTSLDIHIDYPI